mmetsp:Transcript_31481/g.82241  ORF Transcript_31481/g.82241 Transcript_31481/m.82241 type:complete len:209 (-) Transcript_31481:86-712(-)
MSHGAAAGCLWRGSGRTRGRGRGNWYRRARRSWGRRRRRVGGRPLASHRSHAALELLRPRLKCCAALLKGIVLLLQLRGGGELGTQRSHLGFQRADALGRRALPCTELGNLLLEGFTHRLLFALLECELLLEHCTRLLGRIPLLEKFVDPRVQVDERRVVSGAFLGCRILGNGYRLACGLEQDLAHPLERVGCPCIDDLDDSAANLLL